MTGSTRIVDHDTFKELRWGRDSTNPPGVFFLPRGFEEISHLLSKGFIETLEDINAFRHIRDSDLFPVATVLSPTQIDNQQASIQSRLSGPTNLAPGSPLQESCRLAAYLCCAMLRCRVWRTSGAPVSSERYDLLC